MGCLQSSEGSKTKSTGTSSSDNTAGQKKVDPRLPFETYRQLFNLKNSWKAISRKLEDTAKDNLMRFFTKHPEHKVLHRDLAALTDEQELYKSELFEDAAVAIYNVFDEAMEKMDGEVDTAIMIFQNAGKAHARIRGFNVSFFRDMEESFVESAREVLQDRFNDATEKNFHLLYSFACEYMIQGFNSENNRL